MTDEKRPHPIEDPFPHEDIAQIAYDIWERNGYPEDNDLHDWFEAEGILRREASRI